MIHKFRIHFASRNIFKTREGIEIECRFYINADNYDTALQSARVWEQNFIKKNPSIKLMSSTMLQYLGVEKFETDSE